ncbi:hypothetical protein M9H77_28573 [Catharanthus roseus]|uniref:Uncharacterized protein n=1 Tax=Catharanthus roseus TaxID=4058 RepID=A0ACC0AHN6_CATRO|nr:hypothetical protein M9H77_28573 [Catharanthus roseus]
MAFFFSWSCCIFLLVVLSCVWILQQLLFSCCSLLLVLFCSKFLQLPLLLSKQLSSYCLFCSRSSQQLRQLLLQFLLLRWEFSTVCFSCLLISADSQLAAASYIAAPAS